jgi:hypothetical protein
VFKNKKESPIITEQIENKKTKKKKTNPIEKECFSIFLT